MVGIKSAACRYCDSSGLDVCDRMLFVTASYFCVSRGTSHILYFFFLVPLIISCPFFWTDISFLLVWWCIHHHIRLLMRLVGLFSFLEKFVSTFIACLDLVAGVLLCVRTPLCYHMVVFLSFRLTLLQGPL